MPSLYPEKRAETIAFVVDLVQRGNVMGTRRGDAPVLFAAESSDDSEPTAERIADATERLLSSLEQHLHRLSRRLADARYDVVGLTASFGQMFANIALARLLKAACPGTYIVMGGSTVSSRVGPSALSDTHPSTRSCKVRASCLSKPSSRRSPAVIATRSTASAV